MFKMISSIGLLLFLVCISSSYALTTSSYKSLDLRDEQISNRQVRALEQMINLEDFDDGQSESNNNFFQQDDEISKSIHKNFDQFLTNRRYIRHNHEEKFITSSGSGYGSSIISTNDNQTLPIHVTAIHVDKSEFPLSRQLFRLTLRLALNEASRFLEQSLQQQQQQQQQRLKNQGRNFVRAVKLKLSVRSANTCSRQYAGALAAEEFYVRHSRLFVVSGCDDAIRAVSRLASRWQVPVMTAAGFGSDLNDKSVHKTLIRVAFSLRAAVEFLFKIMKSFQWRRINLIVDESDTNSLALKNSIEQHAIRYQRALNNSNNTTNQQDQFQLSVNTILIDLQALSRNNQAVEELGLDDEQDIAHSSRNSTTFASEDSDDKWPNEMTEKVIRDTLWQSSIFSRVSVLLIPQNVVRKFLLSAYDQGMANGLYTFINMPLLLTGQSDDSMGATLSSVIANSNSKQQSQPQQQQTYQTNPTGENVFLWRSMRSRRNAQAKQAFESLMSIYLRTPTTKAYVYFVSKLNELANSQGSHDRRAQTQLQASPVALIPVDRKQQTLIMGNRTSSLGLGVELPQTKRIQLNTNPYSASFYDGLQIYATALLESIKESMMQSRQLYHNSTSINSSNRSFGLDLHARISDLVRNRRFDNMVTGNLYINQNGDRETDYTLDDLNMMTGKFAPVIIYRGITRDIERLGRIHWSSDATVGPTSDIVDCTLIGTCISKPMTRFTLVLFLLAAPLIVILVSLFYFVNSKLSLESQLVDYWWKIHLSDIEIVLTRRKNANDGSLVMQGESCIAAGSSMLSGQDNSMSKTRNQQQQNSDQANSRRLDIGSSGVRSGAGAGDCDKTEVTKATDMSALDVCYGNITLGIYKLSKVALKPINKFHQSRKLMIELRSLKEINHNNLCRFVGILVDDNNLSIVSEFCPKGSLREFFHNDSMVIDWTFKYSIINDIIAGLLYLHSSPLAFHGRLKSSNCLVSARFVVKLSDYGPHSLYNQLNDDLDHDDTNWLKSRIWLAPEHMKSGGKNKIGSVRGDVYSFGLLLYEIMTNCLPLFNQELDDYVMPLKDLYYELKSKGALELMEDSISAIETTDETINITPLVELMRTCLRFEPAKRPSSIAVNTSLKKITRGVTSKKLLENLTSRMEQYTNNLESLVEAKLATLLEEKQRTEELLYQFVPKSIASLLKEGQFVEPEAFDCVTVFYSDIVGFTSLSSESSPMEVVNFLSDLYLCFDSTLEQHDIFKVDTIGDAYIVASGLPQRNEDKHVIEIAYAALELRDRLKSFRIPHKPEHSLEMRVGIHSGPCIAGIVGGLNMPKYCVFGDTLTIGKFMESSGLPMRIHITEESKNLLDRQGEFSIELRVPKITRNGLPYQTYWLEKGQHSC